MCKESESREEQDQVVVARVLSNFRSKDESRAIRRRDQNQARRRMMRGSSSTSNNTSQQFKQWRSMDLLSLLLPPARAASKILPPISPRARDRDSPCLYPSTRPIPVQAIGRSQAKMAEVEEHHQRDEEEWVDGKSNLNFIRKPTEKECPSNPNASSSSSVYGGGANYRPFPLALPYTGKLKTSLPDTTTLDQPHDQTHIKNNPFGNHPTQSAASAGGGGMYRPRRSMVAGGGGFQPHRIAPAVQIRSVIPVCAAPPPPPPPLRLPPPNHPPSEASSAAGLKFNKPELYSATTQLSSEFNKLQL